MSKKQKKSTKSSKTQQPLSSKDRFGIIFQDVLDAVNDRAPQQYKKLVETLYGDIKKNNFLQDDKRFDRKVWALPGHFIVIGDAAVHLFLLRRSVLAKYLDDWNRMMPSFLKASAAAKKDPNDRQLVVFNDRDYDKVHQCFTHLQFVYTGRKEFDMYVYQRSADMEKLLEDLTFFVHLMEAFEIEVGKKVTKLVVVYGNIHAKA